MISSILQREFLTVSSTINMVWTPCENLLFERFIKSACNPCNLVALSETYYGMNDISIVVCNNRLTHLDQSISLAKFFYCPLIIIDHSIKSDIISNKISVDLPIEPFYQIALSKEIYISWNKIQNSVLEYDINNEQTKSIWKNLIFQLCKSNMVIKDEQITENEKT